VNISEETGRVSLDLSQGESGGGVGYDTKATTRSAPSPISQAEQAGWGYSLPLGATPVKKGPLIQPNEVLRPCSSIGDVMVGLGKAILGGPEAPKAAWCCRSQTLGKSSGQGQRPGVERQLTMWVAVTAGLE
jgi:hypothetical protein